MLGRNKTAGGATKLEDVTQAPTPTPIHEPRSGAKNRPTPAPSHEPRPGAKNRPTPKRKDAQAARRQPLVPADRKAAKEADRERTRASRAELRAAADRGEDRALPARDRGPEKRYIRDRVDARLSAGEVAMPLMFIVLILTLLPYGSLKFTALMLVWLVALVGFIDAFLLYRRVRTGLLAKFGEVPSGAARYTVMRAFQLRRARFPRPAVNRGDKVA